MVKQTMIKAFHLKAKENEIYLKNTRPLLAYKKRIKKLLLKGTKIIKIYALSSAIRKAIIMVQSIRKVYPILNYKILSKTEICVIQKDKKYEKIPKSAIEINLFFDNKKSNYFFNNFFFKNFFIY